MAMANDSFGGSNKGRFSGTEPVNFNIAQTIPGAPGFFSPTIPTQGNSLGDTVYFLVSNVFDPRVMQNNNGTNRYSAVASGYAYNQLAQDFMFRLIFEKFRMRSAPDITTIYDMVATIADISRMLGIYLTALTMKQSRDPQMFARARQLSLNNTFAEMQAMLQYLPLPSNVLKTAVKYVRLMDVTGSNNYQNIGFLVNGDYDAFVALAGNVRSRPLALNFLRQLYPEIGVIGDPGSQYNADVMEAFSNANLKLGTNAFAPYVTVEGSSGEVKALSSFGCLASINEVSTNYTVTGWAVPGSGVAGVSSVTSYLPYLCRWKTEGGRNRDGAIAYGAGNANYSVVGDLVTAERVQDPDLAANITHEYNIASSGNIAQFLYPDIDNVTGDLSGLPDALAQEDVRYRVTAGFSLEQLSYKLDGNIMTGVYSMLAA